MFLTMPVNPSPPVPVGPIAGEILLTVMAGGVYDTELQAAEGVAKGQAGVANPPSVILPVLNRLRVSPLNLSALFALLDEPDVMLELAMYVKVSTPLAVL